jgi:hypothetical protein
MTHRDVEHGFDRAVAMVPSCTLDTDARAAQKARYREVGSAIRRVHREAAAVLVDFDATVNPTRLHDAVAIERQCCPFLCFDFDRVARRLTVTTADPALIPALDAIEAAVARALR